MDAVVLVGGEGTRLRPLTYDVPKQMLPVVDRTMIEHVVAALGRGGVDRVVLSLGHRPEVFVDAFSNGEVAGIPAVFAAEPELLDTAGAIAFAAGMAGVGGTFVVQNGDVLSDFDLSRLVSFHHECSAEATIQLTPVEDPSSFGVVPSDESGRVLAFIEKPPIGKAPTNLINAGCYVLEPSVLGRIPAGRRVSIERETFPELVAAGTVFALASDDYWLDTGTPEKFLQASLDILSGRRTAANAPDAPEPEPGVFVGPGAHLEGAVSAPCYVGPGAFVAEGADVAEAVLCRGASVAPGGKVSRSILMAGARVEEGAVVERSIVGPGAVVGAGARVAGLSVLAAGAEVRAGQSLDGARYPNP